MISLEHRRDHPWQYTHPLIGCAARVKREPAISGTVSRVVSSARLGLMVHFAEDDDRGQDRGYAIHLIEAA